MAEPGQETLIDTHRESHRVSKAIFYYILHWKFGLYISLVMGKVSVAEVGWG